MADRIQLRRDTKANWEQYNPILLEGEPGHVLDDPNLYKMGDGVHAWNQLPYRGYSGNILQTIEPGVINSVPSADAVFKEIHKLIGVLSTTDNYEIYNNNSIYGRIRCIFKIDKDTNFEVTSKNQAGVAVDVCPTLNDARLATNSLQSFGGYQTSVTGKTNYSGFLVFSLKKTDESLITPQEQEEMIEKLFVTIYANQELDNTIKSINGILKETTFDKSALTVYRVDVTTGQESPTGQRLRCIMEISAPCYINANCSLGKGVSIGVYSSFEDAILAYNQIVDIDNLSYSIFSSGLLNASGYLGVSLCKSDESSFSDAEMTDYVNNLNIKVCTSSLLSDINTLNNIVNINEYNRVALTVYRVDVTTGQESPTGQRLRCIMHINNGADVVASCNKGRGVGCELFNTLSDAKRAANPIETISHTYQQSVSGSFTQSGYITISLCKSDESSFSDAEIIEFKQALIVSIKTYSAVLVKAEEQIFTEKQKSIIKANIGIEDSLPYYWEEYLSNKLSALNQADANLGRNGVSFAFITDIHVDDNAGKSPMLLEWIKQNTNVKDVVCGGDLLYDDWDDTSKNTRENALKQLNWWKKETSNLNIVNIRGNHDSNEEYPSSTGQTITLGEFYALECRQSEKQVNWIPNTCYGYNDNENQKVRYIFLDSLAPHTVTIDDTQINWMKARIQELSSEWTVILFVHGLWTITSGNTVVYDSDGEKIVAALDSIYDSIDATIACVISGHAHVDFVKTSEKGIVLISTTCDTSGLNASWFDWNYPTRTAGTTTEQCFDLFYIDTQNRTIKSIRIGAGDTVANRNINY